MLSQLKPPFRAEHIGSLLRPKALLDQRAKFAAARSTSRVDRRPKTRRSRTRSPSRSASDSSSPPMANSADAPITASSTASSATSASTPSAARMPRGHGDRHDWHACFAAGREDQEPGAVDPSDQRAGFRIHPRQHSAHSEDHHSRPLRAAFSRRRRRGAGLDAYTDVDAFWDDTVEAFGRELRGALQRRLPLRADRRDGVRQVRRSGSPGAAQEPRRRLERADRQIRRRHQSRAQGRAGRHADRHAPVPRQPRRPVALRRQLRRRRRASVQRAQHPVLFP